MHLSRTTLAQAAVVAALAGALYSFNLAASPPHLTHDEIKFALQAKSIADSGRDINGRLFPIYFREPGFSVGRDPLCIYFTAAFLTILPLSDESIRLPTAVIGGIGVGLIYVLARLLFERQAVALSVAAVLALSPTYVFHSRLALSVIYPVPFTIAWLVALRLYLSHPRPRYALACGVVLGAGIYSYLAAALMMPLYFAATAFVMLRARDREGLVRMCSAFALMLVPIVVWQIVEPERYANILSAYRLYDAEPSGAGKLEELMSTAGLRSRVDTLWDAFNPARLFFTGESSLQISTREVGSILTSVAVFLAFGVAQLARRGASPFERVLLFGLATAPLPAVLMADVEIRRWLVVLPFVAAVSGYGIDRLLRGGWSARAFASGLIAAMIVQFAVFERDFFGEYRLRSSVWFGGNIRGAVAQVITGAGEQQPARVYIASDIPWVEAYWRFYSKVHAQDWLLARTQYVHLANEAVPVASEQAVMLTPIGDAVLADRMQQSGWVKSEVVPDLDGAAMFAIWSPEVR